MIQPSFDSMGNPWYARSGEVFAPEGAHRLNPAPFDSGIPHWYSQLRAKEWLYDQPDFGHKHDVYVVEYSHCDGTSDLYFNYKTGAWLEVLRGKEV